jgi:hypothetical protein
MKKQLPKLLAVALFSLSLAFATQAAGAFYLLSLPPIEPLGPSASLRQEYVARLQAALPAGQAGELSREALRSLLEESDSRRGSWQYQVQARVGAARTQLLGWLVAFAVSVALMYLLRSKKESAA